MNLSGPRGYEALAVSVITHLVQAVVAQEWKESKIKDQAYKGKDGSEGNGDPLQYSCLENSMDGGTWWGTVHGVAKSWTRLSDFTFFHYKNKRQTTKWKKIFLICSSDIGLYSEYIRTYHNSIVRQTTWLINEQKI